MTTVEENRQEVISYYAHYNEDSRLIKDYAHRVEFDTSLAALDPWLSPGAVVLDAAAGTGRYAFHLAARGCRVHAMDLVPCHVDAMRFKAAAVDGNIPEMSQGDARDLSRFADGSFDAVLCMGPLYHLPDQEGRRACLGECARVTRPGGVLALSYLNEGVLREIDPDPCFHGVWPEEIAGLAAGCGLEVADHLAADGVARQVNGFLNELPEEGYRAWLAFHEKTCRFPAALRHALHALMICRKPSWIPIP